MNPQMITLDEVRVRGIAALSRELGVVGMVRFLQQFETGRADYSRDRHVTLDQLSVDQIVSEIRARRSEHDK